MGIKDLLKAIGDQSSVVKSCSVADFKGMSVAVDASSWLQKAVFSSAEELMDQKFDDHMFYVDFLLFRARNFRIAGVEPVMVFEGRRSTLKAETQLQREELRQSNMDQGMRLLESMSKTSDSGCRQKLRSEALACFQRGLKITHDIEKYCISALKKVGVSVIVAPYEADAQLAYLCHIGMCRAVLTEDSDLIAYSAICGTPFPILYKFESSGMVQAVSLRTLGIHEEGNHEKLASGAAANGHSETLSSPSTPPDESCQSDIAQATFIACLQKHFSGPQGRRLLIQMCIIAGCQQGLGIMDAQQLCVKYKDSSDDSRLVRIVRQLDMNSKYSVRLGCLEKAMRAEALFYYHPVYDPISKSIRNFSSPNIMSCCSSNGISRSPQSSPLSSRSSSPTDKGTTIVTIGRPLPSSQHPLIDMADLLKLGTAEDILDSAPAGVSVQDVCEGKCSYKDFTPIVPMLPWDRPEVRALSDHRGHSPTTSTPNNGSPRARNNCWLNRSNLVKMLSNIDAACTTGHSAAVVGVKRAAPGGFPAVQSAFSAAKDVEPATSADGSIGDSSGVANGKMIDGGTAVSAANLVGQPQPDAGGQCVSESSGVVISLASEAVKCDDQLRDGRVQTNIYGNFHTPPSNGSNGLSTASSLTSAAVQVLSPQHSRLACDDGASSPILSAVAPAAAGDMQDHPPHLNDKGSYQRRIEQCEEGCTCDEQDIVAVKRKLVDAVAVSATGRNNSKGKRQKTLMVASIKSYFSMPR